MVSIGRASVAGLITMTIFVSKAISKYIEHPVIETLLNPYVIFVLFCAAGTILLWPFLKGWRAFILGLLIVIFAAFFVYSYYVI